MSSRRRPYLNLKQSITELFKTPAHWLKEQTGKWSIFEKPYLDQEYRQMHLNWSWPRWGGSGGSVPPHVWPEKSRKHTFIFSEGDCSIWSFGGDCGEIVTISGWIWDPYFTTGGTTWDWKAVSSHPEEAKIISIESSLFGISVDIEVQLSDTWTGTAVISVSATMIGGTMLKEIAYEIPSHFGKVRLTPGWIPNIKFAFANLLPLYEKRATIIHNCGTVDIEIACCDDSGMAWDSVTSAETVAREASAGIAITDSTGMGGPYTWVVSGTGFWFDAGYSITSEETIGLGNTLYADATACGSATITVTGCNGTVVTAYVRCTTGVWSAYTIICDAGRGCFGAYICQVIEGNRENYSCLDCVPYDCPCEGTQVCDLPDYATCWPPCSGDICTCGPPDGWVGVGVSKFRLWECA